MDMTKAFDNVRHSTLFQKLLDKGIPPIFIRLLVVMYDKQVANVKWINTLSKSFSIKNGVKQGAVLSPRLFCVYTDDLFTLLRKKRTGCWVNGIYIGIVGYADDLLLLSPTLEGLQEMVKTCEDFAHNHNLKFSTSTDIKKCKTKCMAFTKRKIDLKDIKLNGKVLPWVTSAKHLGCKLTNNINGLSKDILEKRAQYINRANELDQEFYFAHAKTRVMINNIFNTSFYGSQIWDLFDFEAERVEKTWNVSQRIFLKLPRNSHRFFIEPLSGTRHIRFAMLKRFVNFIQMMASSSKRVLRFLLMQVKHDCRSTTGRNLRKIMLLLNKTNKDTITKDDLNNQVYVNVPSNDEWKVNIAKEIVDIKNKRLDVDGFSYKELNEMLEIITT